MKLILTFVGFLFLLALGIRTDAVPPARADAPPSDAGARTLLPGARADYRFDYKGDRTRIGVALDAGGIPGVELYVYTPAEVQAAGRGGELQAIGRGTPNGEHDAFWTGSFPAPGVYQVAVENHSPGVVLYTLSIEGEGVSGVARLQADPPAAAPARLGTNTLTVSLPPGADRALLRLNVPAAPPSCTHAYQIPPIISFSIKLCPNEVYPPLRLAGSSIALYADEAHSSIITSGGRQYAVTVEGSNNFVEGITIQAGADAADLGAWLCQYDECTFATRPRPTVINGGLIYGGGILLRGSNSVIHGVTVRGGTIGIATADGWGNVLLDNQLNDLNGWGIYNLRSTSGYFVGNTLDRENHGCTTPDGFKFLHGCETAGWVCLGCQNNLIARNHCEASANCFYMSGERGLGSHNNKFLANYCGGATDNCFELTFSRGNVLQDNITTSDPSTGAACKYPFWIGGSTVYMKGNIWQCGIDADKAMADAVASTSVPTLLLSVGSGPPPANANPGSASPAPRPARPEQIQAE